MKAQPEVQVDPITLGLVRNYLSSVADEMANTVIRTAYSTIVRDCMDFSTALCDRNGQMVAQGVTIPFQLGSIPAALGSTLRKYQGNIHPGDVFIMNDPFDGGIHIPDIFLFRPIFYQSELIGFSVVISHHVDVGGRVPGSAACDNTEIFQDGLRIPPLKLYDRGLPSEAIFEILEKNVRVPVMVMGDLRANLAACKTGEKGMLELARRYGPDALDQYYAELLDYTERMVRAEIQTWPDGEYSFTDYLDDDGVDPQPIPIHVKMTVHGDSVTIDFNGTSPQVRGGINCPLPFTVSCCGYAVRSVMQADIPNTSGLFRPIEVIAPEASIVNPVMPAASGMRGVVGFRLSDALFGALSHIIPHKVPAAGEGGNSLIIIGGYNRKREPFVMFDLMAGTWGARPTKDGNDGLTNPGSVISNIPAELMELEYPVRVEQYSLTEDTGGAGRFRGGLAIAREWRYLGEMPANLSIRSDRRDFPPYGLFGGKPGAPSSNVINPGTPGERVLRTKVTDTLNPGDLIRHVQAGGGGWGDPLERDPSAVLRDVFSDKVSLQKAEELYGVVIDPGSLEVDGAATERRRAEARSKLA
jgi:N-methylhydantoinase B